MFLQKVNRPGPDPDHPPFQDRDRLTIELNLYLPYMPAWHEKGQPLPQILPSPATGSVGVNGAHLNPEERPEFR